MNGCTAILTFNVLLCLLLVLREIVGVLLVLLLHQRVVRLRHVRHLETTTNTHLLHVLAVTTNTHLLSVLAVTINTHLQHTYRGGKHARVTGKHNVTTRYLRSSRATPSMQLFLLNALR